MKKFQVYNFVKLTELYYAGSHGMDIKGPEQGSKYEQVRFLFTFYINKILETEINQYLFLSSYIFYCCIKLYRIINLFFANQLQSSSL